MAEAHDERRERLLNAATGLFLRNGYDSVSIDGVIAEAGGSKREIYRLFGGKPWLFEAVVRGHCANTPGTLADFDPAGTAGSHGDGPHGALVRVAGPFGYGLAGPAPAPLRRIASAMSVISASVSARCAASIQPST